MGFLVKFGWLALAGFIDGGVEAFRGKFPDFRQKFPTPFQRFLLKVVPETPVPQHFKESVVVGVEADIFEVVVLAAGADAFLGIGGATRLIGAFGLAKENGHELVHAGVREQQVRRIRHETRRRHNGVLLRLEEVEERLPDLRAGHHRKTKLR